MIARKRYHPRTYRAILDRQDRKCAMCGAPFNQLGMCEFDHIVPLGLGGKDEPDNLQAICIPCHKRKTHTRSDGDLSKIAKADRIREKCQGTRLSKRKQAMAKMMGFERMARPR